MNQRTEKALPEGELDRKKRDLNLLYGALEIIPAIIDRIIMLNEFKDV